MFHYLHLGFNSPFVNLHLSKGDYIKFLKNPHYYIEQEIVLEREGDMYKCLCPYGRIGEGDDKIVLAFNHHTNFAAASKDWNRRKNRINWDNIFVKMSCDDGNASLLKAFDELNYAKKAVFCPARATQIESSIFIPKYIELCEQDAIHCGSNTFSAYVRRPEELSKSIDLFKLFLGEKDFRRETLD